MSAKPVVYFIDDSATMREVIKIAFRREELDVITCHDANSALDLMDHSAPDVVITDVIMPGRDGYELCQYIKQNPRLASTPVILMSGVVNKGVAERAFAVRANELIRKPFQPQDLIARVRHLLTSPADADPEPETESKSASVRANDVLSAIFSGPIPPRQGPGHARPTGPVPVPSRTASHHSGYSIAETVAAALTPPVPAPPVSIPGAQITGTTPLSVPPPQPGKVPPPPIPGSISDLGKLRLEILRLRSQIKKLELELAAEREYSHALEQHVTTLQDAE